jgi:hypothetical protein
LTFGYNTSYYNTDNSISNYASGNYLYVSGNGTTTGGLYLQGAGNQKQAIVIDGISTGGNIAFTTNATEAMRLDSSQNLLVGTTSNGFSSKLVVKGTAGPFTPDVLVGIPVNASGNTNFTIYRSADTNGYAGIETYQAAVGGTNLVINAVNGGNLLVGTTSGSNKLTVQASTGSTALVSMYNTSNASGDQNLSLSLGTNTNNTSSYFLVCQTPATANRLFIYGNGNVVNLNNSYGALSDAKLKENIVDASPKLADLMQVKVRNYNLIGETTKQIGVVAQELETVFPSMIDVSPDIDAEGNDLGTTTKSVKYSVFVPMLIKAIQELSALVTAQSATITSLTERITALENK